MHIAGGGTPCKHVRSGMHGWALLCMPCHHPSVALAVSGKVAGQSKFHISVGHDTVMAQLAFFGLPDGQGVTQASQYTTDVRQVLFGASVL